METQTAAQLKWVIRRSVSQFQNRWKLSRVSVWRFRAMAYLTVCPCLQFLILSIYTYTVCRPAYIYNKSFTLFYIASITSRKTCHTASLSENIKPHLSSSFFLWMSELISQQSWRGEPVSQLDLLGHLDWVFGTAQCLCLCRALKSHMFPLTSMSV